MEAEEVAGYIFEVLAVRDPEDLPTTRAELATLIEDHIDSEWTITTSQIHNGLVWTRDNAVEIGWCVPNVRAGHHAERVYRIVEVDEAGTAIDPAGASAIEDGWKSRVEYAVTTWRRGIHPLRLAAENTRGRRRAGLRAAVRFAELGLAGMEAVLATWDEDLQDA